MVIAWRLRGNIIITALCWIAWPNIHSLQHTYVCSSYRSNRLWLSHWDYCTVYRGGCLELYYCNTVEWFWWDSSLILTTNWFPSVLWHCWFGHLACKIVPEMTYYVSSGTLNPTHSHTQQRSTHINKWGKLLCYKYKKHSGAGVLRYFKTVTECYSGLQPVTYTALLNKYVDDIRLIHVVAFDSRSDTHLVTHLVWPHW